MFCTIFNTYVIDNISSLFFSESPIKLKKPKAKKSPEPDHSGVIAELMRKNPDLFKGNKPVKIKVMTKDAEGKSVVKVITVKAQPHLPEKSIDMTSPKPTVVQQVVAKKSIPISVSPRYHSYIT